MNVILISIESANPRYFEYFGGKKNMLNLESIKKDSVGFFNCFTGASFSPVGVNGLLTGKYHITRQDDDWMEGVKNKLTIADILKQNGYVTLGYSGLGHIGSNLGYNKGFDRFDEPNGTNKKYNWPGSPIDTYPGINKSLTFNMGNWFVDRFLEDLKKNINSKFFMYAHYAETHIGGEDVINREYIKKFPETNRHNSYYDAKLNWLDTEFIGPMLSILKEYGVYENTMIIFTGDHGESMGYHGESTHGLFIYAESMRVPLIMKVPMEDKFKGNITPRMVRSIDIAPTILDILGIKHEMDGKTVFDINTKRIGYMENYGTRYSGEQRGIITETHHFIRRYPMLTNISKNEMYLSWLKNYSSPDIELFNIEDEYEKNNIISNSNTRETGVYMSNILDTIINGGLEKWDY